MVGLDSDKEEEEVQQLVFGIGGGWRPWEGIPKSIFKAHVTVAVTCYCLVQVDGRRWLYEGPGRERR